MDELVRELQNVQENVQELYAMQQENFHWPGYGEPAMYSQDTYPQDPTAPLNN